MIASLAMYDFGACSAVNDRLWAMIRDGLRARAIAAPDTLTRGPDAYWPAWQSPGLVLAQTCGYPFRAQLHDKVALIGTPDFGVIGCPPGYYCSVFIARADDPRDTFTDFDGAAFVYNEAMSQSGWAAPQVHAADVGISLPPAFASGGHRLSAQAVAQAKGDIAAIDAVTFRLIQREDPDLAALLKPVASTRPTPGLPYIAAKGANAAATFDAIADAIDALSAMDRNTLGLHGLVSIPAAAYLAVPNPPAPDQIAQLI